MKIKLFVVTALIAASLLTLFARDSWTLNFTPANTSEEFQALVNDPTANIIRSKAEFVKFINSRPKLKRKIKAENLKKVTSSLKFRNNGLAGMIYGPIVRDITPSELNSIFEAFGMGPDVLSAWDHKYCADRGTCRPENRAVCTDNC